MSRRPFVTPMGVVVAWDHGLRAWVVTLCGRLLGWGLGGWLIVHMVMR